MKEVFNEILELWEEVSDNDLKEMLNKNPKLKYRNCKVEVLK